MFTKILGVGKLVYDININYLGVRSHESGEKKEEEIGIEGESFWVVYTERSSIGFLSGHDIIPQITNVKN